MIEHVCVRDEAISLDSFNLDAEDSTSHHHSYFRVFLKRELTIIGHLIANRVIVLLNISNFLRDLILKGTALEPGPLLLGVKNGEVIESLRQDVDVLVENGLLFATLLHHIGR